VSETAEDLERNMFAKVIHNIFKHVDIMLIQSEIKYDYSLSINNTTANC